MRNLDIALARAFVAVADHGGMTAAGNVLNLTQSAISQQVKRLEDALGHELFLRDRRGLKLSGAGERLLGKARRLLALNDEIWSEMKAGAIAGRVRFGVPYDLIGASIAPALRSFARTCPQVEISLVCASSPQLLTALGKGEVDLAVVEEPLGPTAGECLGIERLVWVGARGGGAHLKETLPISMVADTCAFRPAVVDALREGGRDWRTVFENGNIEATTATVRTDLAVTAWLASTVPADLDILGLEAGLPDLPPFAINLHMSPSAAAPARELARHVRDGLVRPRLAAQAGLP